MGRDSWTGADPLDTRLDRCNSLQCCECGSCDVDLSAPLCVHLPTSLTVTARLSSPVRRPLVRPFFRPSLCFTDWLHAGLLQGRMIASNADAEALYCRCNRPIQGKWCDGFWP